VQRESYDCAVGIQIRIRYAEEWMLSYGSVVERTGHLHRRTDVVRMTKNVVALNNTVMPVMGEDYETTFLLKVRVYVS